MSDFIWTDELVEEFAKQYRFSSSRISIEMFKEGKGFPVAPSNDEDELWEEVYEQMSYERMELLINDCTSIEELSNHKDYVNKNPDLMPVYMNKLKSLEKEIAQ